MKRAIFIGRWSPFHKGHLAIMQEKIDKGIPLLILVRHSYYDIYPPMLRKRMIEAAMSKLKVDTKVMIIDDIESVNFGRGVGYDINEIKVAKGIQKVSATQIRSLIEKKDNSWKNLMPEGAAKVLEDYLKDTGIIVWFTGLPKSGKSTIARLVAERFDEIGRRTERIDSKFLRKTISKDLGFEKEDRDKNIERAMHVAKILARNGTVVLCSFITPYEKQRTRNRKELKDKYIEVFVKATVKRCKERDEELYKDAADGKIPLFTGISDKYETPRTPDITLDSDKYSFEECADKLFDYLKDRI